MLFPTSLPPSPASYSRSGFHLGLPGYSCRFGEAHHTETKLEQRHHAFGRQIWSNWRTQRCRKPALKRGTNLAVSSWELESGLNQRIAWRASLLTKYQSYWNHVESCWIYVYILQYFGEIQWYSAYQGAAKNPRCCKCKEHLHLQRWEG